MVEWLQIVNDGSIPFLLWLQSLQSDWLTGLMQFGSYLGTEYGFILLFPFVYWCINKRWGIQTALALVLSLYVTGFVKWTFQLPRPPSPPVQQWWTETSPGFVSGHAATSMAIWGTLAFLVRKTWFTIVALLLIMLISISRMYLGVHYPADVIGGWLVGIGVMWIVLWFAPRLAPTLATWSPLRQILGVLILGALMIVIFPGDWDNRWPAEEGVRETALLVGALLGIIWDEHRIHFSVRGTWGQRLLRYLVGLVVLALAFWGLSFLFDAFPSQSYALEQALRFVRYAIVGLVATGLGPWLFFRLHLI